MMNDHSLVFAPVYLPVAAAALALVARAFFRGRAFTVCESAAAFVGLALPWLALAGLFPSIREGHVFMGAIGSWGGGLGIHYRFDALAWLVNVLGLTLGGASWLHSRRKNGCSRLFTAMFLIQSASLAAAIMTADIFNLYVCLEVMGITSYVLIAESKKPGAALASFSYLMVSAAAMVFFLLGLYGLYRLSGSLSYDAIAESLRALPDAGGYTALISICLIIASVVLRVAVMPLYGWLPDAHAMAPHAVSAVLSGVLIKTPLFALTRFLALFEAGQRAGELLSFAGALSAFLAAALALSQRDIKRILAYSSISQIGFVVCAWGAALSAGIHTSAGTLLLSAAFLYALYHAVFKGLLFLTTGSIIEAADERDIYRLRGAASFLRARGEKLPLTALCFAAGLASLAAFPLFSGYAGKTILVDLFKGLPQEPLLLAAGGLTVAYVLKLSRVVLPLKHKQNIEEPETDAPGPGVSGHLAQCTLALLCLAFGVSATYIYALCVRLLSGGLLSTPVAMSLFSPGDLLKFILTLAGGILLFLAASSRIVEALQLRLRRSCSDFQGLFVSFVAGLVIMVLWLIH